jgi:hypothetical protein
MHHPAHKTEQDNYTRTHYAHGKQCKNESTANSKRKETKRKILKKEMEGFMQVQVGALVTQGPR